MTVRAPIIAPGPMATRAPMLQLGSTLAVGSTLALGCVPAITASVGLRKVDNRAKYAYGSSQTIRGRSVALAASRLTSTAPAFVWSSDRR